MWNSVECGVETLALLVHCACAPYFALSFNSIRQFSAAITAVFGSVNGQIKQAHKVMNSEGTVNLCLQQPESAALYDI